MSMMRPTISGGAHHLLAKRECPGGLRSSNVQRGKATIVLLALVAVKKEWRIRDITWQVDGKHQTLRGIYVH
jgi:hypothetical protein